MGSVKLVSRPVIATYSNGVRTGFVEVEKEDNVLYIHIQVNSKFSSKEEIEKASSQSPIRFSYEHNCPDDFKVTDAWEEGVKSVLTELVDESALQGLTWHS